jgi:vitamin B12 transporter
LNIRFIATCLLRASFACARTCFIVCVSAAGIAGTVLAQTDMETVVVTATRIPTPESQVASSITVISAEDIAAMQVQTLPDALRDVAGLNLVQTGGAGGQTSIYMRGANSNHVKVLVDGIDMGDPSSPIGAYDFGAFLTGDIQSIEVLRGPQSGLYGSDAIGGVINVITKAGSGPAQFSASAEGGSFDTFNQNGSVSGSSGGFHYSANIEHFHSGATPVTPLDLLLPGERRIDDYYDNLTASTRLGFDLTDSVDVGLVARYTDTHLRLTGENENDYPADFPDFSQSTDDTRQYYARATAHAVAFDGVLDHTVGIAYGSIESPQYSPDYGASDYAGDRLKADWQGNIKVAPDQTLILGAEHERDAIKQPIEAGTTIDSGYAELQSQFGRSVFDTVSIRYDDNDRFGGKLTYRFAPAYVIQESGTKLKASIGSGFKAPTLSEMFENFPPYFYGNPNLKPESSVGWDAGVEQVASSGSVELGVTYFRNRIRNLIDSNADDSSYANVGRARTDGIESYLAYRPGSGYSARLDYTFTEAVDEVADAELLRRPKHKASLRNSWQAAQRLSFDATVLYVGYWQDGNRDFSVSPLRAPGFTTVNLAANFAVNDGLALYARIDNLFDRHYQDPIGFLQPSLGAYAGVKIRFR